MVGTEEGIQETNALQKGTAADLCHKKIKNTKYKKPRINMSQVNESS